MAQSEFYKKWGEILAQTWADPAYRSKVEADPAAALTDQGIAVPKGVVVSVKPMDEAPGSATVLVLPFPPAPSAPGLRSPQNSAQAELALAAGSCCSSSAISCCCP